MTGLERAIKIVGGQAALARKLGLHQTTVWEWVNQGGRDRQSGEPPPHFVVAISQATGGLVDPHEIRPDVFNERQST